MSRILYTAFAIIIAMIGLVFHVRNNQRIELDFVVRSLEVDLSWVVVAALILGALLGLIAMAARVLQLKGEVRRLSRQGDQARRELSSLRAVALKDDG